ncbi:response regulator transcription factor [Anaerocolumna sp. AGMB13025]|uniref:response regulator transcription factor n=1 Tax=Anaerocolumna sp. AGMB13025 TaxID=3039116 RepID=UPI00242008DF|nr:response regulator transcription factor [Anaerocolumna sp. AGMB13025]WFR58154.1 response regulator transcription factor [Anaerocolumna sp. AGMB13025]
MRRKILIADDEKEIVELIEIYLLKEKFEVIKAYDGLTAWKLIEETESDLAVIDIMMPGMDGFQLVRRIREKYHIPVIVLSAKNTKNDIILGLGLGADDYVTKPFDPLELTARIQSQIRRFYQLNQVMPKENNKRIITSGNITLDLERCIIKKCEKELSFTSTEFRILSMLMQQIGRVFTKKQIFERVWEDPYNSDDSTIMVHMSNIREKIEDDPKNPYYIKTVRGLGYKFDGRFDSEGR